MFSDYKLYNLKKIESVFYNIEKIKTDYTLIYLY